MYSLVGIDGNAYSVMSHVIRVMKVKGFSKEEIEQYKNLAMSGTYSNLIVVSMDYLYKCKLKDGVEAE